jgi:hypothetical protein
MNTEEEKKYTGGRSPTPFYEDANAKVIKPAVGQM